MSETKRIFDAGVAPLADPIDVFFVEWGQESAKKVVPFFNDTLSRFATLDAALLGGSMAFLDARTIAPVWRSMAMMMLMISLASALWGMLPYGRDVNVFNADDVRRHKNQLQLVKETRLRWSAIFLFAGLTTAVLGCVFRQLTW